MSEKITVYVYGAFWQKYRAEEPPWTVHGFKTIIYMYMYLQTDYETIETFVDFLSEK